MNTKLALAAYIANREARDTLAALKTKLVEVHGAPIEGEHPIGPHNRKVNILRQLREAAEAIQDEMNRLERFIDPSDYVPAPAHVPAIDEGWEK